MKSLQETTGARVWVSSFDSQPSDPHDPSTAKQRVMEISGLAHDVDSAERTVRDSLASVRTPASRKHGKQRRFNNKRANARPQLARTADGDNARFEQCLSIPSKSVGMIIGRGGEVVKARRKSPLLA